MILRIFDNFFPDVPDLERPWENFDDGDEF